MSGETTIYRYEVPVNGEAHEHHCGPPLAVASRKRGVIEFWAHPDGADAVARRFIAVGTGHALPGPEKRVPHFYRGTVLDGPFLAWHLIELS